jgi:hypothetical protein
MKRHRKDDLGARRHVRINLHKPGFLIPAPDAPWIECTVVDVSEKGVCLDVGSLPVPELFGLSFTTTGRVLRVCALVWRQGEMIGAEFLTANELRGVGASPDKKKQKSRGTGKPRDDESGTSGWVSPVETRARRH